MQVSSFGVQPKTALFLWREFLVKKLKAFYLLFEEEPFKACSTIISRSLQGTRSKEIQSDFLDQTLVRT